MRYQRSEALPDVTVDLAKGAVVTEGLPAAALTSNFGQLSVDAGAARWFVKEVFGAVADAGQQSVFGGLLIGRITISASKARLTTMLPGRVQGLFAGIPGLKGTYTKQTVSSGIRVMSEAEAAETMAAVHALEFVKPERGSSSRWAARVTRQMARLDVIGSLALAAVIEGGFSLYEDVQMRDINGLTDEQIAQRGLVRVFGGLLAAGAGTLVAGLVGGPAIAVAAVGITVAVAVHVAWEWGPVQVAFQGLDLYGPYEPRPRTLDLDAVQRRRFIR